MKIFKKIKKWLLSGNQDDLNEAEAWAEFWKTCAEERGTRLKDKSEEFTKVSEEFTKVNELVKQRQGEIFQLKKELREKEDQISVLKDEIDIQKCKAAKYLSYYLEEMEKHAPND